MADNYADFPNISSDELISVVKLKDFFLGTWPLQIRKLTFFLSHITNLLFFTFFFNIFPQRKRMTSRCTEDNYNDA